MKKPSLVLLAKTDKLATKASQFVCRDTKQTIFTNIASEAISPFTGTSFLEASDKKVVLDREAISSYAEIATCPTCETVWSASKDFITANDSFHCVICNDSLEVKDAFDTSEEKESDAMEEKDSSAENEPSIDDEDFDIIIDDIEEDKEALEENKEVSEGIKEENKEEDDIKQDIENKEATDLDIIINDESEESKEEVIMDESAVTIEIKDPEGVVVVPEECKEDELPEELKESLPEVSTDQGFDIPESIYTAGLSYNLAYLLTKAEYKEKVELVASYLNKENPLFYIIVSSVPVAVVEFNKASEAVKAMFGDSDLLKKALQMTLSNSNEEESALCLKDFGVQPITVPIISNTAAVSSNVAKVSKALIASFKEKEAEMFNTWRESFTTSALMYCKNLQKKNTIGKPKSLITKAAINETLKSFGIKNADLIVEEAFKRGIQHDYGVIVEEALSLYTKTPEARKEVRDFVADADYQADVSLAPCQANTSRSQDETRNEAHQTTSSNNTEGFDSIMANLKGSIRSRVI